LYAKSKSLLYTPYGLLVAEKASSETFEYYLDPNRENVELRTGRGGKRE
jgi:hypothetical protein